MKILVFLISIFLSPVVFGHGEDRPGPNGGFIRMPGAFHIEVVPAGTKKFKIFLLDIDWKNPSLTNSSLEVSLEAHSKIVGVACVPDKNYYQCSLPDGASLKKRGKLLVVAKRESMQGVEISYELPLRLEGKDKKHSHH